MAGITKEETERSSEESICDQKGFNPSIIGLYGIPGSGKSHYISKLQERSQLDVNSTFQFFDGSSVIDCLVPGGLPAFKELPEEQKAKLREEAIGSIKDKCTIGRTAAIVAGHATFWDKNDDTETVITPKDLEIYSHIIYLKIGPEVIQKHRIGDWARDRDIVSIEHLEKWQNQEENMLRTLCRAHGISFRAVSPGNDVEYEEIFITKLWEFVSDLAIHDEDVNWGNATTRLQETIDSDAARDGGLKKMLVMDADKTLAPQDVGDMFWEKATFLYEEAADDGVFDTTCEEIASEVTMYTEFLSLLHQAAECDHVGAVVVTCGLRSVWEKVLAREGLSESVKVIGGGRISDGFVVTAEVKADLVAHIRDVYQVEVCAFGDSPLDLPVLMQADQAIVVVGDEDSRSKSMEAALEDAIRTNLLTASQLILPNTANPRLDSFQLPLLRLSQADIEVILCDSAFRFIHATHSSATALLTTQTRDATVAGPALRGAHRAIGWYLAVEFIGKVIGLDSYEIPHVQSRSTEGHRLKDEKRTTIVPLMRGGGPMAEGVSEVFPLAMFVHASKPNDLKLHHIEQQDSIILVDSVINSGKSIVEFIEHVRNLHATIRIVIIANVVQEKFVTRENAANLGRYGNVTLIALRLSKNQFTGSGGTDTGNLTVAPSSANNAVTNPIYISDMDNFNTINGPSRPQRTPTGPLQSFLLPSSPAQYEGGNINTDGAPYQNSHRYSYEPTLDADGTTSDRRVQAPKYNELTDDSQLALPALEAACSSDEYSDSPSTPTSMLDETVNIQDEREEVLPIQPLIPFPTANESGHYAEDLTDIPPTSPPMYYPNAVPPHTFHQTYAQTSTLWRRLELSVQVRLYTGNTSLEVFRRLMEAEVERRVEERAAATQRASLDRGRGPAAMINDTRTSIEESNTIERIRREVEALQHEMGIFHLVNSSRLPSGSLVANRDNNTFNEVTME
ncbi:hypothetical protein V492_03870 [Pseudogymnoascus sp. VKM F-4246]|nr:hypothetical protein V492_03870 [Pseudogymnoascus sp. VKM F-4246]